MTILPPSYLCTIQIILYYYIFMSSAGLKSPENVIFYLLALCVIKVECFTRWISSLGGILRVVLNWAFQYENIRWFFFLSWKNSRNVSWYSSKNTHFVWILHLWSKNREFCWLQRSFPILLGMSNVYSSIHLIISLS